MPLYLATQLCSESKAALRVMRLVSTQRSLTFLPPSLQPILVQPPKPMLSRFGLRHSARHTHTHTHTHTNFSMIGSLVCNWVLQSLAAVACLGPPFVRVFSCSFIHLNPSVFPMGGRRRTPLLFCGVPIIPSRLQRGEFSAS